MSCYLCYMTCVMLCYNYVSCYITCVLLCYITYVMLCYNPCVMFSCYVI